MTTKELANRLKSFSDTNRELSQRITKLSKLSPSIAEDSERDEEPESRVDLAEEIHANLKDLEAEFELLKQEAEDVTGTPGGVSGSRRRNSIQDRDRIGLITQIERFGEDLKSSRSQFRRAQLQAKRNEEAAQRKAREQLFASVDQDEESRAAKSKRRVGTDRSTQDDLVVGASSDVTASLRRTHQLLEGELQRSRFAHETLQNSTNALNSLNESYSTLDDLLASAKGLISTLVSSQKSDTWYLESAVYILVGVIGWLIFRRWFFGPIKYFIWWPIRLGIRLCLGFLYTVLNLLFGISAGQGVASGSAGLSASSDMGNAPSSSTTSLKIQPSAAGGFPKRAAGMEKPSIKVGLGGGRVERSEAEMRKDEETRLSDEVGKMADGTKEQEQQQQGSHAEGSAGGGTVLRERAADERPNPKKRMMEEPPAGARPQDEL